MILQNDILESYHSLALLSPYPIKVQGDLSLPRCLKYSLDILESKYILKGTERENNAI